MSSRHLRDPRSHSACYVTPHRNSLPPAVTIGHPLCFVSARLGHLVTLCSLSLTLARDHSQLATTCVDTWALTPRRHHSRRSRNIPGYAATSAARLITRLVAISPARFIARLVAISAVRLSLGLSPFTLRHVSVFNVVTPGLSLVHVHYLSLTRHVSLLCSSFGATTSPPPTRLAWRQHNVCHLALLPCQLHRLLDDISLSQPTRHLSARAFCTLSVRSRLNLRFLRSLPRGPFGPLTV